MHPREEGAGVLEIRVSKNGVSGLNFLPDIWTLLATMKIPNDKSKI